MQYDLLTEQRGQRWRGSRESGSEAARLVALSLQMGPSGVPVFECVPLEDNLALW